jgi:hypothetical protein
LQGQSKTRYEMLVLMLMRLHKHGLTFDSNITLQHWMHPNVNAQR